MLCQVKCSNPACLRKKDASTHPCCQGCQMVCFHTKNPNLGKFWRALDWKMLIHFMTIWNILQTFGIFYNYLAHFVFIWYISPGFGIMYQEISGNPACYCNAET
jgi:hypothetical protein